MFFINLFNFFKTGLFQLADQTLRQDVEHPPCRPVVNQVVQAAGTAAFAQDRIRAVGHVADLAQGPGFDPDGFILGLKASVP